MNRLLLASAAFALVVATLATAQDPPPAAPAQPGAKAKATNPFNAQGKAATLPAQGGFGQPGGGQPANWGTATTRVTAAKLAQFEEEFETLEAHRDVKKAIVRAAEVAVKAADVGFERISKTNIASKEEVDRAKLEVEAARAQLDIRMAEMKEVEVKIKFAKKRLDEAKALAAKAPPAKLDPKPVDPPPPPGGFVSDDDSNADDTAKQVAELKAKLEKLTAESTKAAEASKKAAETAAVAADELAKIKEVAMRGRVRAGTIEAAEEKAAAAQAAADKAKKVAKALEEEAAAVKAKLKEIEK